MLFENINSKNNQNSAKWFIEMPGDIYKVDYFRLKMAVYFNS